MNGRSEVVEGLVWTEKYRPSSLSELGLEEATRNLLESFIKAGEIPHLFLHGPAGSGKTCVAQILIESLDCRSLELNASSERGIDVVREKIGNFAVSMLGGRWNIVFLDESDALTGDAQTALRNQMEATAERTRFILTANYPHKIISPIQSRCQSITLGRPPLKERFRVLESVLKAEGIAAKKTIIATYAERYGDMRQMLWAAQRGYLGNGGVLPPASEATETSGDEMFAWVTQKNFTAFRHLTASADFDPGAALRELWHAIPDEHPKAAALRVLVGTKVHESIYTPDPIILFLSTVSGCFEAVG